MAEPTECVNCGQAISWDRRSGVWRHGSSRPECSIHLRATPEIACGICGGPPGDDSVQDVECGTCCAEHYDDLPPVPSPEEPAPSGPNDSRLAAVLDALNARWDEIIADPDGPSSLAACIAVDALTEAGL